MAKSISSECSACGTKFRVTSATIEPVAYCPFCGDPALLTPDDEEDEVDDDDDGLRELNPDDED